MVQKVIGALSKISQTLWQHTKYSLDNWKKNMGEGGIVRLNGQCLKEWQHWWSRRYLVCFREDNAEDHLKPDRCQRGVNVHCSLVAITNFTILSIFWDSNTYLQKRECIRKKTLWNQKSKYICIILLLISLSIYFIFIF